MNRVQIDAATAFEPTDRKTVVLRQDDGTGIDETVELDVASAMAVRDSLNAWLFTGYAPDPEKEDKVAVMLGDSQDGEPPVVILAMGQAAWDYIKDGKCHQFDLRPVGLCLRMMIAGGATRGQVISDIARGIDMAGGEFEAPEGALDRELGIKPPVAQ